MANWIDIINATNFPKGTYQTFDWNGLSLLIFNIEGQFYAIKNLCTHEDQTLEGGELEKDEIVCPWHGASFCVKTGAAIRPPAYTSVQTFPVRLFEGKVQVEIDCAPPEKP